MSSEEGGNGVDKGEYAKTIADIREWLVKIDTNQTHQTKLLETINAQATNAFSKADTAEDKADKAYELAQKTESRLDKKEDEERSHRRWVIGLLVTICIALIPIFNSFYL